MGLRGTQGGCRRSRDIAVAAVDHTLQAKRRVLLLAVSVLAMLAPPALAGTGSISGNVTDAGGTPLAKITVSAIGAAGTVAAAGTAADGTYTIGALPAGAYSVKFAPAPAAPFNFGGGNYLHQFYNGQSSLQAAQAVTVVSGENTPDIDARLPTGGTISGQVLDQSNAPVEEMWVRAYEPDGESAGSWPTDAEGRYSIHQLQSGSYAVAFEQGSSPPNDLPQFYAGRAALAGAHAVTVTAGEETTGIDAHVTTGGQVTGTVTDPNAHDVEGASVELIDGAGRPVGSAQTASDGSYAIDGLESGTYFAEFRFHPPPFASGAENDNLLETFFNDEGSLAGADPVVVTLGATTSGVNATLPFGGELKGTVTGAGDAPLANVGVTAYNAATNTTQSALTGADGSYTVGGLSSGSYRVRFAVESRPLITGPGDYATQLYGGGSPLEVTAGETISGIDAQLQPGATISGTVSGPGGSGIGGIGGTAYDASGNVAGTATTAADGSYTIPDLSGGTYRVDFTGSPSGLGQLNYLGQFFASKTDLADATPVSVAAGGSTAGINAQLSEGGRITGTVTDSTGNALVGNGIQVGVYDASEREAASGFVGPGDETGIYSVGALPTGIYRVAFESFAGAEYAPAGVSAVSVTAGATTANVNAQLSREPGAIAGTVSDGAGHGVGADVTVYDADGNPVGTGVSTPASGSYAVTGLAPGFDRIGFTPTGYPGGFYGGATTLAQAAAILVVSGATATGIDAQLPPPSMPTITVLPPASPLTPSAPTATAGAQSGVAASHVVVAPKSLTRAQKLAKALIACRKLRKNKRAKCVTAARKRYRLKQRRGMGSSSRPGPLASR
jgi:Carboxypeptidase regulatory-like domain